MTLTEEYWNYLNEDASKKNLIVAQDTICSSFPFISWDTLKNSLQILKIAEIENNFGIWTILQSAVLQFDLPTISFLIKWKYLLAVFFILKIQVFDTILNNDSVNLEPPLIYFTSKAFLDPIS